MTEKNVDDLLVSRTQEILNPDQVKVAETVNSDLSNVEPDNVEIDTSSAENSSSYEDTSSSNEDNSPSSDASAQQAPSDSSEIDEYGMPVAKPRTYTEDEVQRMIRDRLRRGNQGEQPTNREIKEASQDFKPDPNSEDSWEAQLEKFVDSRIESKEQRINAKRWKEKEDRIQAEFEDKFDRGMARYRDFHEVVSRQPITDSMMLATRALEDPAAFIYAASKSQAKELERISKIPDAYQQAAEIGRLEARMRKARNTTNASKPLSRPKSDVVGNSKIRNNIDDLIRKDAQRKFGRR